MTTYRDAEAEVVMVDTKGRRGVKEAGPYPRWGIMKEDGGGRHGVDKG